MQRQILMEADTSGLEKRKQRTWPDMGGRTTYVAERLACSTRGP